MEVNDNVVMYSTCSKYCFLNESILKPLDLFDWMHVLEDYSRLVHIKFSAQDTLSLAKKEYELILSKINQL
jgi:hypothetical protein